jgi:hypothetical protein
MAKSNPSGALNPLSLSAVDLCGLLLKAGVKNLTPSAIGKWVHLGCPRSNGKSFNLLEVLAWFVNERAKIPHRPPAESDDVEKEKLAVLRERKLTLRQNRLASAQKLIDRDEVEEGRLRRIHALRSGLLMLSRSLAREIAGKTPAEVQKITDEQVNALLEAYAEGWRGQGEIPGPKPKKDADG